VATIADVAKAAGVSISTVSYVLSGKRPISAPTRRRVERAIQELAFEPHAGARALASSRTEVIALVAPLHTGVDLAVIMQFVAGVVAAARTHDYDVLLLTQDGVGPLHRVGSTSMADALVVMDVEADDDRLPTLQAMPQPVTLIGLPRDPGGLPCVDLDFEAAGRLAVRHLAALGHRHIGFLGAPSSVLERHTSYADRMRRGIGIGLTDAGVSGALEPAESSDRGARDAVDRLLTRLPGLTALVVHNEGALPWVLAALHERGYSVPDDVSVLAVCPADVAERQAAPVTAIDIPGPLIGKIAVDMVVARLVADAPAEIRLLSPTVTSRSTTAPAPTR
jgi:DNA-binding LacI/PurR family transcriptional regulator